MTQPAPVDPPPPPGVEKPTLATNEPWWKRPWGVGLIALVPLLLFIGVDRLGGDTPEAADAEPVPADGQADDSDEADGQGEADRAAETEDEPGGGDDDGLVPLPDVLGMSVNEARSVLREAGFTAIEVSETTNAGGEEVGVGTVARMAPTAGSEESTGAEVRLYEYVSPIDDGEYGSDPQLDRLYDQCEDGDNSACLELLEESEPGSEYSLLALANYEEPDRDLGDTIAFGDWEMTLQSTETHNTLGRENARGTYVVAIAEFTNNGSIPNQVGTNFLLADLDSGSIYEMDSRASLAHHHSTNSDSWHLDDIGPGLSAQMALAFDVSDENGDWRLGTFTGRGTSEDDLVEEYFRFSLD